MVNTIFKRCSTHPTSTPLNTVKFKGESEAAPEWYVPYKGQKLSGQSLLDQIQNGKMQVLLNQAMLRLYVKLLLILNGLIYLTVRWCYLVQPQKQDHYLG